MRLAQYTGLAVLAGPVLGGAITQGIAWQWIFWLNVPIGLLTIPVVLRRVDESYGPRSAPDIARQQICRCWRIGTDD